MTPTDDMMAAIKKMKKMLDEANVPREGRYVYYPQYETNTADNRIIYTDNEEGNVQMTERTIEAVDKDMIEVNNRLLDRRFVYGPVWNAIAVSFDIEHETDCSDEQREKNFKNYLEGSDKGVVTPTVQSLDSMDKEVTLTNGLMKKIHEVSMDILRKEAIELRKLRAEQRYLEMTGSLTMSDIIDRYADMPQPLR